MSICVQKYPLFTLKDTELLEEWTVDVLESLKIESSLVVTKQIFNCYDISC